MNLPTHLYLGHLEIPVIYETLSDVYGESEQDPPVIRLDLGHDPEGWAGTLLHELLHHVSWTFGLEWEETDVLLVEHLMVGMIKQNPVVFQQLASGEPVRWSKGTSTESEGDPRGALVQRAHRGSEET